MCKAICPQCGFEFEAKSPAPIVNARWVAEEDATLLRLYQNERKTKYDVEYIHLNSLTIINRNRPLPNNIRINRGIFRLAVLGGGGAY